jgi:hypothetical protein
MTRLTRQQSRKNLTPASGTPTTNTSPLFSNRTSVRSETPITSVDDNHDHVAPSKKRAAEIDENIESEDESSTRLMSKRRAISKNAYIEIPVSNGMSKVITLPCCSTLEAGSSPVFVR